MKGEPVAVGLEEFLTLLLHVGIDQHPDQIRQGDKTIGDQLFNEINW